MFSILVIKDTVLHSAFHIPQEFASLFLFATEIEEISINH